MSTVRRPCPACDRGPRDTALAVTSDDRGTIAFCHRCGYTKSENHVKARGAAIAPRVYRPWREIAAHLWNSAEPLAGSLADVYLRARGCRLPPEDGDLRFLPARGAHPAAVVGRVTDAETGEPISLHFTRMSPDGKKVGPDAKRLLAGHRKSGGVIRLWPDECVTHGLLIAEGVETALAAAHGFAPVWAAIDCGNLQNCPVLSGIECLTIAADHDPAGISAAEQCAQRWAAAGREVRIAMPSTPGHDAADVVAA